MLKIFIKYMGFTLSYQSLNLVNMLSTQNYNLTLFKPWKYLIEFSDYPQLIFELPVLNFLVIIPWPSKLGERKPGSKKSRPPPPNTYKDCYKWLVMIAKHDYYDLILDIYTLDSIRSGVLATSILGVCVCVCVCVFVCSVYRSTWVRFGILGN